MELILTLFFQMIIGHAIADFVLQPDAMGFGKNRNNDAQKTKGRLFPHWYYWMTSHTLVHSGAVYIITGSIVLGLIELVLHWIILTFTPGVTITPITLSRVLSSIQRY